MGKPRKKNLSASLIVTQSNQLVEARYNLTLGEQRLIFTMISRIQLDDDDFKPYRISLNELSEFLGINKNHMYSDCQKITKKLLEKVVEIQEPGQLLQTHWVSSANYIDGTGSVLLTFDPLLKPYLLQLKGNFTSSRLEMLLSFKSQYTMRMYSLLKQYERLKTRDIELAQLRNILGLRKEQYNLYSNFKKDILEPTQRELKAKADLYFEYDEIKHGRSVGTIRFHTFTKKLDSPKDITSDSTKAISLHQEIETLTTNKLLLLIPEAHRGKKTVLSALESFERKFGFDYVKRNILYCNVKADKSYAGFLHNALKSDWGCDWETEEQKNKLKKKPLEIWERQGFASKKEYDDAMYRRQIEAYKK